MNTVAQSKKCNVKNEKKEERTRAATRGCEIRSQSARPSFMGEKNPQPDRFDAPGLSTPDNHCRFWENKTPETVVLQLTTW